MPISDDLFLAILSMDAYNRDYNQGILVDGTELGSVASTIRPSTKTI